MRRLHPTEQQLAITAGSHPEMVRAVIDQLVLNHLFYRPQLRTITLHGAAPSIDRLDHLTVLHYLADDRWAHTIAVLERWVADAIPIVWIDTPTAVIAHDHTIPLLLPGPPDLVPETSLGRSL